MSCNATKLAEYLMRKYPLADSYPYKSWSYPQGFYLWAIVRLFEKTGDKRYYDYVLAYGNTHVGDDGTISRGILKEDSYMESIFREKCGQMDYLWN